MLKRLVALGIQRRMRTSARGSRPAAGHVLTSGRAVRSLLGP